MDIREAVLHHIDKPTGIQGDDAVTVELSPDLLPVDDLLKGLSSSLCELFNKTNVSYGTFGATTPFPERLSDYTVQTIGMMDLTTQAVGLLKHQLQRSNFATGGYALFLRYTQDQMEFLLIAMLKLKSSAGIKNFRLQENVNIDLSKLHEAARINLTRRDRNEQPYLSFVKGSNSAGRVTEYFRDALACTDYTDAKHFTLQAISAAKAFVEQRNELSLEQKHEEYIAVKKRLVECFDAAGNSEVTPLGIAAAVSPLRPEDFVAFSERPEVAAEYQLKTPFKPHRNTYKGLRRITGTIGSVRIAFDADDVSAGRVIYDEQTDSILITSPGEALKEKIREATPAA
ncbi:nucleoid-associated protein [Comamonas testosteroni]